MNKKLLKKSLLLVGVASVLITTLYARQGNGDRQPPKEAIEICVGQDEGSQCTMNTPRGSLEGQCKNTPDNKYFVCMPEGGPKGPGQQQ